MARCLGLVGLVLLLAACSGNVATPVSAGLSLRFYGNGVGDIDRVKIRIDEPADALPGPPIDVGAADFTIEFWMRALASENQAGPVACGASNSWINGNIIIDRDRFNQDRAYGISIAGGLILYGIDGEATGSRTVCSATNVLDGGWHHIAVQRRRSDGRMWLFVDGVMEAVEDGPGGDVSYPDDGIPGNFCGGPCDNSDPFIVLGAEKHDAGPAYPSFSGWLDELRFSDVLRYAGNFTPPTAPYVNDASTVGLFHFEEGVGGVVLDGSFAAGGPSDGDVMLGGTPAGPEWSPLTPFN